MANTAVSTWISDVYSDDQMAPLAKATSSRKSTNPMLKTLLPSMLPMASSGAPNRIAANDAANSGSEVLNARNWVPTKLASQPIASAMRSPLLASHTAAPTTSAAETR